MSADPSDRNAEALAYGAVARISSQLAEAEKTVDQVRGCLSEALRLVVAPHMAKNLETLEGMIDSVLRANHARAVLEQQLREARRLAGFTTERKPS